MSNDFWKGFNLGLEQARAAKERRQREANERARAEFNAKHRSEPVTFLGLIKLLIVLAIFTVGFLYVVGALFLGVAGR